jgi:prepilin-type N-terminal cleavage/methylation domain-containing protein
MRNKQKGFSLIELLIVVAIILIIAAIAIPNLLRSKMAANQASAVASLRTLNTSTVLYYTNYGIYPTALSQLGPVGTGTVSSTLADMIDSTLAAASTVASGGKSGYYFTWAAGGTTGAYTINADPVSTSTGQIHYFTDNSLVIRSNSAATATSADNPIGN